MPGRRLVGSFAFALLALGCGSGSSDPRGDETPTTNAPPKPLPECPFTDYTPCDIRKAKCQDFLLGVAACMRGSDKPDALQIDLMTEAEFTDLRRQDYADVAPSSDVHFGQALAPLGLAQAETYSPVGADLEASIKAEAAALAGEYRPTEKRVIIIDRDQPADSLENNLVLVHELVHALQDIDHDLTTWPGDRAPFTLDHNMALASVTEGEARFYELRASVPFQGFDIRHVAMRSFILDSARKTTLDGAKNAQPYSESRRIFPYSFGALQAYDASNTKGQKGIDALYTSPPATTQSIIASTLVKDEPQDAAPVALDAPMLDPLLLDTDDTLGAWGLMLFLTRLQPDFVIGGTLAAAWRNDHLWAFTDHTNVPTYMLWELELGDETSAAAVDAALEQASTKASRAFTHGVMGTRVFASAGYADPPDDSVTAAGMTWLSGN